LRDVGSRELKDLLGAAVDRSDALLAPNRDNAARHVRQDALAELLLALELVVERDIADRVGQVRAEIEERLGLSAAVRRSHHRLPHGEDADELAARKERYRED